MGPEVLEVTAEVLRADESVGWFFTALGCIPIWAWVAYTEIADQKEAKRVEDIIDRAFKREF